MATVKRTRRWGRRATSALVSGGVALAALGGPGAPAQAVPGAPVGHWCPGEQWDPSWGSVSDWDWHQCHDWQRPGGPFGPAGAGQWGPAPVWAPPRPPQPTWAPGANLMWNPLNGWGFWNNGIWTPA